MSAQKRRTVLRRRDIIPGWLWEIAVVHVRPRASRRKKGAKKA